MNLVFLYGPPAAGKYTIGKKLAEETGFTFLHNHLSGNLVRELIDDVYDPVRIQAVQEVRLAMIKAAARLGKDCITTHAFTTQHDLDWVQQVIDVVESNGGTINFVQLIAPIDVLLGRATNPSRTALHKVDDVEEMRHRFEVRDYFGSIDYKNHITIDTASVGPQDACQKVIGHFHLSEIGRNLS